MFWVAHPCRISHGSKLLWQADYCALDTTTVAAEPGGTVFTHHRPTVMCMYACAVLQVMTNASYARTARGIAAAMQRYAAQRQPYERAADEVELSILTAHVQASAAAAAAAAAAGKRKATAAGAATSYQQPGRTDEL
jgi:hypothetical protein